ncbi:MAG TPA: CoA-binding protein [bacterium]|nr:CoA-binding protein [bacterium]
MPPKTIDILNNYKTYAVVGATTNQEKYGYKVFRALIDAGYTVYPLNPNYPEIDGIQCYADIAALPVSPDVVVSVVPPHVTLSAIDAGHARGVQVFWMQPGAWSEETVQKCIDLGIEEVHENCIISAVNLINNKAASC